jgi:hypothetical protein
VLRKNKFDYSDAEFFGLQNEIEERYSFTTIADLTPLKPSVLATFFMILRYRKSIVNKQVKIPIGGSFLKWLPRFPIIKEIDQSLRDVQWVISFVFLRYVGLSVASLGKNVQCSCS